MVVHWVKRWRRWAGVVGLVAPVTDTGGLGTVARIIG